MSIDVTLAPEDFFSWNCYPGFPGNTWGLACNKKDIHFFVSILVTP
jgi:hypothetical protein